MHGADNDKINVALNLIKTWKQSENPVAMVTDLLGCLIT